MLLNLGDNATSDLTWKGGHLHSYPQVMLLPLFWGEDVGSYKGVRELVGQRAVQG